MMLNKQSCEYIDMGFVGKHLLMYDLMMYDLMIYYVRFTVYDVFRYWEIVYWDT